MRLAILTLAIALTCGITGLADDVCPITGLTKEEAMAIRAKRAAERAQTRAGGDLALAEFNRRWLDNYWMDREARGSTQSCNRTR